MFGKKSRRIKELESKIDCYVAREYKTKGILKEKDKKIEKLQLTNNNLNNTIEKLKEKINARKIDVKTLEQLRVDRKLTKQAVAAMTGSTSSYYLSELEKGKKNPTLEYICKLAKVYKVTPAIITEALTLTKGVKK